MSRKHEQNLRHLAVAEANARIARVAFDHTHSAITMLEVGLSSTGARAACDSVQNAMRHLESEIAKLERVICS
jgi:hypothetical protein